MSAPTKWKSFITLRLFTGEINPCVLWVRRVMGVIFGKLAIVSVSTESTYCPLGSIIDQPIHQRPTYQDPQMDHKEKMRRKKLVICPQEGEGL